MSQTVARSEHCHAHQAEGSLVNCRTVIRVLVLSLFVLVAACGGGDDDGDTASVSSSPATAEATATAAPSTDRAAETTEASTTTRAPTTTTQASTTIAAPTTTLNEQQQAAADDGDGELSAEDQARVDEFWAGISEVGHDIMCRNMETAEGRLEVVEYFTGPDMGSSPLSEEQAERMIDYLRTDKC